MVVKSWFICVLRSLICSWVSWLLEWSKISSDNILSMLKLFSQMFISLTEDVQISLMNDLQVVFHSYLTIWISMLLHFERMFCIDRYRFSTAAYCRIMSTMYVFSDSRCYRGRASHFCWISWILPWWRLRVGRACRPWFRWVGRGRGLCRRCTRNSDLPWGAASPHWRLCSRWRDGYLWSVVFDGEGQLVQHFGLLFVEGLAALQQILHFTLHF